MILFRADANSAIGMGHVMRALSIADALSSTDPTIISSGKQGIKFLIADESVSDLIRTRGYEPIVLHTDYQDMDGETEAWKELSPSIDADLVIVDSYFVTNHYLSWLRYNIGMVCYVDDILAFPYTADVVVNYNVYASETDYHELYKGCEEPELLLGPTYAPLRDMFRGIPSREQREEVHDVLLSTGGSDVLHVTKAFLEYLCENKKCRSDGKTYHILLGAMNKDKHFIHELACARSDIIIHENVANMRELISSVDVIISAAGSTLYEICACGVPLITYILADNQIPGASSFSSLGLAIDVGDLRDSVSIDHGADMSGKLSADAVQRIMNALNDLEADQTARTEMSKRQHALIDGHGAERLAARLMEIKRGKLPE